MSEVVISNIGAPQGNLLMPFLFTIYTSGFHFNTGSCHLQTFSDYSSIVGCIDNDKDKDEEYRGLMEELDSLEAVGERRMKDPR